ncbi:MAG: hypothetical protein JKY96_04845 [Phycisphaerales bacterium]|nr:hypothetical protein [Phycisphaerales bacterium]
MTTKKKKPGRAIKYSLKLAEEICRRIADGESLRHVCEDENMPAKGTVFTWLNQHPKFEELYSNARDRQADTLVDDIIEIADDERLDPKRARVKIAARQWLAARQAPKKYGDRMQLNHAGEGGGAIQHEHSVRDMMERLDGNSRGVDGLREEADEPEMEAE